MIVCVYTFYIGAGRGKKMALGSLDLNSPTVVRHVLWVSRTKPGSSARAAVFMTKPSIQPLRQIF